MEHSTDFPQIRSHHCHANLSQIPIFGGTAWSPSFAMSSAGADSSKASQNTDHSNPKRTCKCQRCDCRSRLLPEDLTHCKACNRLWCPSFVVCQCAACGNCSTLVINVNGPMKICLPCRNGLCEQPNYTCICSCGCPEVSAQLLCAQCWDAVHSEDPGPHGLDGDSTPKPTDGPRCTCTCLCQGIAEDAGHPCPFCQFGSHL